MAESIMKKRLLYLLKLLSGETDESNPVSTADIMEYFKSVGLSADRKTLKNDIDLLIEMGYDIVIVKSSPNKYFMGDRVFQIPELKLLIDAVSSSRFITAKKSDELIQKLSSLVNTQQAQALNRHVFAADRVKADNESIYYIVDAINDAINDRRKIVFQYTEYTGEKQKVLRNGGEQYTLSPYALYWNDDFYYAVGYSDKHEKITAFRVDRLYKVEVTETEAAAPPEDFDVADYSHKIFEMFDGEEEAVELECENSLMKYVVDRFGEDVSTRTVSEHTFIASVNVAVSPTFYGWVFQFRGKIRIVSPQMAIDEYEEMARAALSES